MSEDRAEYFVDGVRFELPADTEVSEAANLALGSLGRAAGSVDRMILARESGEPLDQEATIGEVCEPGERLKLVAAPEDDG